MGHKIFVSYKYADDDVQHLIGHYPTTVRDYVTEFQDKVDISSHIYKGESDNEDLSLLSDDEIWESLKDRIYDSTLTIIFVSPNMVEKHKSERNQWIPWEVSYSLKEISRKDRYGNPITSKTNAMLAVVLPDAMGSYSYYLESKNCCVSGCQMHHTDKLFGIIARNKFNKKNASKHQCDINAATSIWEGTCSYIEAVKWCDFIKNTELYIQRAYDRQDDIASYIISKEV